MKTGIEIRGPNAEERKRLLRFVNVAICGPNSVEDVQNQRELKQLDIEAIRALIQGNPAPGKEK